MAAIDIDAEIKKALDEAYGKNASKIEQIREDAAKAEYEAYKKKIEGLSATLKTRDEVVKDIKDFWFNTLASSNLANFFDVQDHEALKAITSLNVQWKPDPRAFTITFTFAENKYFSDKELSKTFEVSTEAPKLDKFSLNVDLKTTPVAIKWKSDAVNLVKLKPRPKAVEQEEFDEFEDAGSFFNFFADSDDKMSIGDHLTEIYLSAHNIFAKIEGGADLSDASMNSSDEEDEDDAGEVDLEEEEAKRAKKRSRRG